MISKLLTILLMYNVFLSGYGIDPMLIERPEASYADMLDAVIKFNSFEFDDGVDMLGFPPKSIEKGGFFGKSQYNVAMFRGIKYATAKRFEKPVMLEKLDELDVLAYNPGPSCPQPSADFYENGYRYSEDCLYLDVYVPLGREVVVTSQQTPVSTHFRKKRDVDGEGSASGHYEEATTKEFTKDEGPPEVVSASSVEMTTTWTAEDENYFYDDLPVIIAFHGEEFTYVASSHVDGRVLARYGNAIVVVVNYRTGVLGFLSSGDERIKGNLGLHDQRVAIQWVKNYITHFGGDPNQITLLGFSSGAESVSAQMLNPMNDGLFKKVILQSGVTKQGSLFYNDKAAENLVQRDIMQKITKLTECNNDSVNCLRNLNVEKLISKAGELAFERKSNRTFGPTHDDEYFTEEDSDKLLSKYEIIIGLVENEAGKWLNELSENLSLSDVIRHEFASNSYFHCAPEPLVNFLKFEYRASSETDEFRALQKGYLNFVNDYSYIAPAVAFANKAVMAGATVYFYNFQAPVSTMSPGKPSFLGDVPLHGEDQSYLFGMPLLFTELYTSSARNISANYIRMLTNFAHSGNPDIGPTPKPDSMDYWKPFTPMNMETYAISETMEVMPNNFARSIAVWSEAVAYLMSDELCPKIEIETKCSVKSCKYIKDWEKNYLKWRDVDIPKWRETAEKYGIPADDLEDNCEKS